LGLQKSTFARYPAGYVVENFDIQLDVRIRAARGGLSDIQLKIRFRPNPNLDLDGFRPPHFKISLIDDRELG